ncbi:glycosyltransferase family 4 protein [Curtobacterium luteum]|uniref:glycosyltransferase family 4 protein n=1 Tax=Curtobacterium luteum TaxID=33881 RepID=UPI003809AA23
MSALGRTVVVTAFACDPRLPSEPTIGWEYVTTWLDIVAEEDLRLVAVMNQRSRDASTARLRAEGRDTTRLTIVVPPEHRVLGILRDHRLTRLEHIVWGWRTPAAVRREVAPDDVLLARHVTFASELLPPPVTWLQGRALTVWGPVGSTGRADAYRYRPRPTHWRRRWLVQRLRDVLSARCARRSARHVDATLVTSAVLASRLESDGRRAIVFPNTRPVLPSEDAPERERRPGSDLRLLCVGNLVPLKRFELAVAALTRPSLAHAELRVAGKPAPRRRNDLAGLAHELGVADRVVFLGQVDRARVIEEMRAADVLVHLSAREGGSGVVGEATSVGLPVVVFEGTGADAVLTYAAAPGARIPAGTDGDVDVVADAVLRAAREPRVPSSVWTPERLSDMERSLLAAARGGRVP